MSRRIHCHNTGDFGLCKLCPNATYKDSVGNDTCTSCPDYFHSNQGSVSVSDCWAPATTMTPAPVQSSSMYFSSVPASSITAITDVSLNTASTSSTLQHIPTTSRLVPSSTVKYMIQSTTGNQPPVTSAQNMPPTSATLSPSQQSGGGVPAGVQYVIAGNMQEIKYTFINEESEGIPVESFALVFLFLSIMFLSCLSYQLVGGGGYRPVDDDSSRGSVIHHLIHRE